MSLTRKVTVLAHRLLLAYEIEKIADKTRGQLLFSLVLRSKNLSSSNRLLSKCSPLKYSVPKVEIHHPKGNSSFPSFNSREFLRDLLVTFDL